MSQKAKEKLESLKEKRKELNSEIRNIRNAVKREAQKKKRRREAIIGRALIEHFGGLDEAKEKLREILNKQVTRDSDRELLALDPLPSEDADQAESVEQKSEKPIDV